MTNADENGFALGRPWFFWIRQPLSREPVGHHQAPVRHPGTGPGRRGDRDPSARRQGLSREGNRVAVEIDFGRYRTARIELLTHRLDEIHGLIEAGKLDNVEITRDGFSIKPYRGVQVPEAAKLFVDRVNIALPRIKITDLLVEVDGSTGFSEQFTHLRTELPCEDTKDLLTVILADGINLGLTRMAAAAPGSSFKRLSRVADWYVP
jgi:hypothetical protein